MLLAPRNGFVFISMTKAASTSIESAFRPHAQVSMGRNPFKHTNYAGFQKFLQPYLGSRGFSRESYEVVCVFREPVDWLGSWWRYRSREGLADPSNPRHRNYAGEVSFEEFARAFMKGGEKFARVGRPSRFVRPRPGWAEVDRIFRYDRLDLLVEYLCEKVGEEVELGFSNTSPEKPLSLSEECERELRAFFEPEYRTYYERAIGK